jgi:hypothetical protein
LVELSGAFRKHPERKRVDPPTSGPLGDPPPTLDEQYHATWHELASMAHVGVLQRADRILVEIAVRVLYSLRTTALPKSSQFGTLIKCLSLMGMSPVDRSKVYVTQDKPANPFSQWAGKVAQAREVN